MRIRFVTVLVLTGLLALSFMSVRAETGIPTATVRSLPIPEERMDNRIQHSGDAVALDTTFDLIEMGADVPPPSPYSPDHDCELVDMTDYEGTFYGFKVYGNFPFLMGNRFEIPSFHQAEVLGFAIRVYQTSNNAGGVDLIINVHEEFLGRPGTIVHTETIPASDIVKAFPGYWLLKFTTPVIVTGGAYYITFDVQGDITDYLTIGLNQNADGSDNGAGVFYDGSWRPLSEAFGMPINLQLASDVCYTDYSQCLTTAPTPTHHIICPATGYTNGTFNGIGQRFVVSNDTLKSVQINFYNPEVGTRYYSGTNETNGVIVEVWPDDGTGEVDASAGPLATRTIPGGLENMFPVTGEDRTVHPLEGHWLDFSSDNLILRGFFHVTARMTSDDPADGQVLFMLEDLGQGGSVGFSDAPWETAASSYDWMNELWGNDVAFYIGVTHCKDEFSDCKTQLLHSGETVNFLYIGGTLWKVAQKVYGHGLGNKVEAIRFQIADEVVWGGDPGENGSPQAAVNIYSQNERNFPGNVIYSDTIEPTYWPSWNEVIIPDFVVAGDFWVGYELISPDGSTDWFYGCMDSGQAIVNTGAWVYYEPWDEWIETYLFPGLEANNWMIDVDYCYIGDYHPCPDGDWSTLQGDFARTGQTRVSLDNAACDLRKNWEYEHPDLRGEYMGPIISDDRLIATFSGSTRSEYVVFDLTTKDELFTISVPGNVDCLPTVDYSAYHGTDILYVHGGQNLILAAYDLATGALLWDIYDNDFPGMSPGEIGARGNIIILDQALYFTTQIGKVYAVDKDTGLPNIWWAPYYKFPTAYPSCYRGGCTDGVNLYYAYVNGINSTYAHGSVVAVNPNTGNLVWDLSNHGELCGISTFAPLDLKEDFYGGIAVDAAEGAVYVVSTLSGPGAARLPEDVGGMLYKLDDATGEYLECTRVPPTRWSCTPVLGRSHVFLQYSPAGPAVAGDFCQVFAYRKDNLELDWCVRLGENSSIDYTTTEMLLTCEPPGESDLLFVFGHNGGLHCIDTESGTELFSRRITDNVYGGAAGTAGYDSEGTPHLVYETALGKLIDLVPGPARARLELLDPEFIAAVPFGEADPYRVTFEDVFTNTGCVTLSVDVSINGFSNGAPPQPWRAVSPGLVSTAATIADQLTGWQQFAQEVATPDEVTDMVSDPRQVINPSALALFSWIRSTDLSMTVAPGEVADLEIDVAQGEVGRGAFTVYAEFTSSSDPDYWLDDAGDPAPPEVKLVFLGGCGNEYTSMPFGLGLVNQANVWNSGRIGAGSAGSVSWDESGGVLYQGFYIHGINDTTLSFNTLDWSGGKEVKAYRSWLPDTHEGQCQPVLLPDVALASYTEDGFTYTPVRGNVAVNNSLDSVQNMAVGTVGWDWTAYDSPYSNEMTMGLYFQQQTIGPYDFGTIVNLLGNASIEVFTVSERNGEPITDWVMGSYIDYDVPPYESVEGDFDISAGWVYDYNPVGASDCMGMIKIPFGCGYEPMINAGRINQDVGMKEGVPWLYEAYRTMYDSVGTFSMGEELSNDDIAAVFTVVKNDFAPYETLEFATAVFWVLDEPDPHNKIIRLAHQVNKFMGFGRGDVNNDNVINLADIIYLANHVNYSGPGPIPFAHLGDVDADTDVDLADAMYLVAYYFDGGPCPLGAMMNKL